MESFRAKLNASAGGIRKEIAAGEGFGRRNENGAAGGARGSMDVLGEKWEEKGGGESDYRHKQTGWTSSEKQIVGKAKWVKNT